MSDTIVMPRGWKAVTLPPQVEALPKDRRGFPIPYVAEWESASEHTTTLVGHVLVLDCDCIQGEGAPALGKQCPTRQRECMSQRKCQVCAVTIGPDEDCHFLGGTGLDMFIEPPLCLSCALYSLQVCPGITRRPHMGVLACRTYGLYDKLDYPQFEPEGTQFVPSGHLPVAVAMGLLRAGLVFHGAQPIDGTRYTAAEFLEAHRD